MVLDQVDPLFAETYILESDDTMRFGPLMHIPVATYPGIPLLAADQVVALFDDRYTADRVPKYLLSITAANKYASFPTN